MGSCKEVNEMAKESKNTKKVKVMYAEPESFFPKEIRDKYFGDDKKTSGKKPAKKKTTSKKK